MVVTAPDSTATGGHVHACWHGMCEYLAQDVLQERNIMEDWHPLGRFLAMCSHWDHLWPSLFKTVSWGWD